MALNPQVLGNSLINSGNNQIKTGQKLNTAAEEVRALSVVFAQDGRIDVASTGIERGARAIQGFLSPIALALHAAANSLDGVVIPTLDVDRTTFDIPVVGRVRLVTGVSITEARPLRSIGNQVESVADGVDSIIRDMLNISNGCRELNNELPRIQGRLSGGATELKQAGDDLIASGNEFKTAGTLLAS